MRDFFLVYLDEWEKSVDERPGFSKEEKNRMLLSPATRLELRMTGICLYSCSWFQLCAHLIVFMQLTPSSNWWSMCSHCRMSKSSSAKGYHKTLWRTILVANDNPNVQEFQKNMQALRVVKSLILQKVQQGVDLTAEAPKN